MYVYHIDAVKKILPETSLRDVLLQMTICCADHAEMDLPVFLATNSAELSVLQQLEQFCLEGHVDFVDPIEKQRAPVRELDASGFAGIRACERAFFIAK